MCVNGETFSAQPGSYCDLERIWKEGDTIALRFDMSLRLWVGEAECAGKVSLYHGPLLLAYDPRFDAYSVDDIPEIDLSLPIKRVTYTGAEPSPMLLLSFATKTGGRIVLCDFASAGVCGTRYRSWLSCGEFTPNPFQRDNPLRCTYLTY